MIILWIIFGFLALVGLFSLWLFRKEIWEMIKRLFKRMCASVHKWVLSKIHPAGENATLIEPAVFHSPSALTSEPASDPSGADPLSVSEPANPDSSLAREQFINVKDKFFGIYENLYLVSKAGSESPECNLGDWNARIETLAGAPDLKALWAGLRVRPEEFLNFVFSCGVERDTQKTILADENTRLQYFDITGGAIEVGASYDVLQPYWHCGDVILEKGLLKHI